MLEEHEKSTKELIEEIEIKDRRFRLAQTFFMVLVIAFVFGLIYFSIQLLGRAEKQLDQLQTLTEEQKKTAPQIEGKIDQQQRYIECIAKFFAQSNRDNKKIESLDDCQIKNTQTGAISQLPMTPPVANKNPSVDNSQPKDNQPATNQQPTQPQEQNPVINFVCGIPVVGQLCRR